MSIFNSFKNSISIVLMVSFCDVGVGGTFSGCEIVVDVVGGIVLRVLADGPWQGIYSEVGKRWRGKVGMGNELGEFGSPPVGESTFDGLG